MMWVRICIPLNMHVAVEARTGFVVLDLGLGDEGGLCTLRPFEECFMGMVRQDNALGWRAGAVTLELWNWSRVFYSILEKYRAPRSQLEPVPFSHRRLWWKLLVGFDRPVRIGMDEEYDETSAGRLKSNNMADHILS